MTLLDGVLDLDQIHRRSTNLENIIINANISRRKLLEADLQDELLDLRGGRLLCRLVLMNELLVGILKLHILAVLECLTNLGSREFSERRFDKEGFVERYYLVRTDAGIENDCLGDSG